MSASTDDGSEGTGEARLALLDEVDAPKPPPPSSVDPSRRTWLGLLVLAAVALAVILPIDRLRRASPPSMALVTETTSRPAGVAARDQALDSLDVAASLASAAGALARIESLRREPPPSTPPEVPSPAFPPKPASAVPPPPASGFDSPTACMATYLPEVELADRSLDYLCRETEMWRAERKAYPRIAPRGGAGARMWRDLGTNTLAALAVMRAGCCEGAEPPLAVVPGLWCGILRDKLRALGPTLEREPFEDYAETMTCLDDRGVRFPARWEQPNDHSRRAALRLFALNAWRRGRVEER